MSGLVSLEYSGKYKLVANLRWQTAQAEDFAVLDDGYGVIIDVVGTHVQWGIASPEHAGSYSLAALLAEIVSRPTLYIDSLGDDEYIVVAADSGSIFVGLDAIFNETSLGEQLREFAADVDPSTVACYIDPDCDYSTDLFPTVEKLSLREILHDCPFPKSARIAPFAGGFFKRHLLGVSLLSILAIGSLGGYLYWKKYERDTISRESAQLSNAERRAQIESINQLRAQQATEVAFKTDTSGPIVSEFISACIADLSNMGSFVAGWQLHSADCKANGTVSYTYKHAGMANFEGFIAIHENAKINVSTDRVDITTRVDVLPKPAINEMPAQDVFRSFVSEAQVKAALYDNSLRKGNISVSQRNINYEDEATKRPKKVVQSDTPIPLWYVARGSFSGEGLWSIRQIPHHPTLKLDEISFTFSEANGYRWKLNYSISTLP